MYSERTTRIKSLVKSNQKLNETMMVIFPSVSFCVLFKFKMDVCTLHLSDFFCFIDQISCKTSTVKGTHLAKSATRYVLKVPCRFSDSSWTCACMLLWIWPVPDCLLFCANSYADRFIQDSPPRKKTDSVRWVSCK